MHNFIGDYGPESSLEFHHFKGKAIRFLVF